MLNRQQVTWLVALGCFGLGITIIDGRLTQVEAAIAEQEQHEIINNSKQNQLLAQNPKIADNKYFTGALQSCNGAGSTVICTLVYRSKDNFNARINCGDSNTKAFDLFGNMYNCSEVQIGSFKGEKWVYIRYPEGTPIKITLTFKNIPPQTNEFDTLEVHHKNSFLRFNNIQVSR